MIVQPLKMCTDDAGPEQSVVLFISMTSLPQEEVWLAETTSNLCIYHCAPHLYIHLYLSCLPYQSTPRRELVCKVNKCVCLYLHSSSILYILYSLIF